MIPDGTSLYTTQPAPITQLSPIVTPFNIVTLEPTQQCFPMIIGADVLPWCFIKTFRLLYI